MVILGSDLALFGILNGDTRHLISEIQDNRGQTTCAKRLMSKAQKIKIVQTKIQMIIQWSVTKINIKYFFAGLERHADMNASAALTQPICNEYIDVFTGIVCLALSHCKSKEPSFTRHL